MGKSFACHWRIATYIYGTQEKMLKVWKKSVLCNAAVHVVDHGRCELVV